MSSAPVKAWTKFVLRQAMRDATVIVAPVHELDGFGAEELSGKTIITSTVNDGRIAQFRKKGVNMVVDGAPAMFDHVLSPSLLDAMIIAATEKAADDILEDDYLEIITSLELEPRIIYPNGFKRVNRFAFVIHPLSQEYFKNIKPIELLSRVSPPIFMDTLEKVMAYTPPFVYSKVTGIKSPTGVEAEGWLISVGGTPHEIMSHSPEFTYRRLLDAAADRQEPRRADHGPRRIHQGGRRCGTHGVQARAAAHHHGQQLQRLRGAVGRARCRAAPGSGAHAEARTESAASRRWWWAPPGPSARCAPACWRWSPRRSTWCPPKPRSCSRSRGRS